MAVIEKTGLWKFKDKNGDVYVMQLLTSIDNVAGLGDKIDEIQYVTKAIPTTGTGEAYEVTVPGITALESGISFTILPNITSTTTTPTLNVNGLGAKYLRVKVSGNTATTTPGPSTNWLSVNRPIQVTYNGLWWIADMALANASYIYGTIKSETISYSNASSGLSSTDVQAAIDELVAGKTSTQVLTTSEYESLETKDDSVLYILSDDTTEDDIQERISDLENNKADASHSHVVDDISDFPSKMPASDVYDWAKNPTKPTYTPSEIGAQAASTAINTSNIGSQTVNKASYATDNISVSTPALRNQKLASSDTVPSVDGQICWTYG